MNQKKVKRNIILYMILFVFAALIIEMFILGTTNKKQVAKTSQILLEQIDSILTANKHSENEIIEELKIDYVSKAEAVAYILEHNKTAENNIDELKKIAGMMNIDEICLFDEKGFMYGGTHPNYYGLTFDSGEQVSFFKPMLTDKHMTMCQDVTPNTAESKSMMYAISWNSSGTYMVQVGIEPVRLLDALKKNSIQKVVKQMTVYDGMNIYVADKISGEILGSTDKIRIGKILYDTPILSKNDDLYKLSESSIHLDGYRSYCHYRLHDDYIIAVVHSTKANIESFIVAIIVVLAWILIAGTVIVFSLFKLSNANEKINSQMSLLSSISDIYYSMHLIDMSNYQIDKIEGNSLMDKIVQDGNNASDMLENIIKKTIVDEYLEAALSFCDLNTLKERMYNRKSIFFDAIDKNVGWLRMTFITVETDKDKKPSKVIIATQVINEDKKREEELSIEAHIDELTGLYNRRAYENDIMIYPDVPPEDNFVYAAIDVNGLKNVNDNIGHAAGDELLKGAAECLKRTLGTYGKVYRTGGDEFVSIFFSDEVQLTEIITDLEKTTAEWKGEHVDNLSLSAGYVTKKEFPDETVVNMAKTADQRMYKAKAEYYSKSGIDRRGQAEAHKALCNLYTKILKINLTTDSYTIVNMDEAERTHEKGFSEKISEWLINFGKSGQVHQDDLTDYLEKTDINYLKEYFNADKTSINIYYRRKYGQEYKQVLMEMIPANDYSKSNQSLYLYVKSIDK